MGNIDIIPLLSLLGANNLQNILHMPKIFVYINTIEHFNNKFEIGCMINPTLHVNKVLIKQVEKS